MKFMLNKQTGVFVLREDIFDRISRQAKAEVGAEIASEKEQAKRFKNYEEIRVESEKEYNKAKQTKEQKQKEFKDAEQRLTNQRTVLLQFKEGKKQPKNYKDYNESKAVALYLENTSNPKPTAQQIESYINFFKNKSRINDQKQLEQIQKDITTYINYSEETEQIDQTILDNARENVKTVLIGAKIIGTIMAENPEVIPIINKLAEYLCVRPPQNSYTGEIRQEVTDLLAEIPKFLSVKGIANLLINMTPIGTVNLVKSLYIVAKYRKQCAENEVQQDGLQLSDDDEQNNNELNEKKEEMALLYSKIISLVNKLLPLLDKKDRDTHEQYYVEEIENYREVYSSNNLKNINATIESMNNQINYLNNKLSEISKSNTLSESRILKEYREEINNLLIPHMQKQLGFNHPPIINFAEDQDNAKDMVGKTGYYDPSTKEITVFITNRHPKDIMRTVAHEVIHHAQNERGDFDNLGEMGEGYFQTNPHLHKLEIEAYSSGNDLFRKWEENFRKQRNQNTMVNENNLRAKIRSLIEAEMRNMAEEANEPAKEHDAGCKCEECKMQNQKILKNKGLAEAVDKEVMPLKEWRNMELNSLLLNRFGIVSPQVLGEKKNKKPDADGDGVPDWADKKPKDPKVGAKKTPTKKGKIPPQFLKDKKKDESK